jgi:hypothetical protein
MAQSHRSLHQRRGMSTVEWVCILGFGTIVLLASVSSLGGFARQGLDANAKQWGDPSQSVSAGSSSSSSANGGSKSQSQANNGLGNGSDDGTPGNSSDNDGAGTSPGNPGNKGGAKK